MNSTQKQEKTPKEAAKKPSSQTNTKQSGKAMAKTAQKKTEKTAPKVSEKAAVKTAKTAAKTGAKAAPKTGAKKPAPKASSNGGKAEQKTAALLPEKKTYAQRAVSQKETGRWGGKAATGGMLALLAYIFKYRMAGYGFSALVCIAAVGVVLFYTVMEMLGVRYPRFTWWGVRIFTVCLTIGLTVCAVTEGFIIKTALGSPKTELAKCDYVVVLGAKVRPEGPSVSLWDRIYGAEKLLKENPSLIAVVSGGQGPDEVQTEAACMYENLVDLGVEPDRLWMEEQAESTAENIAFSLDLIQEKTGSRPSRIAVLSSEYHLLRASLYAKQQGVQFVGVPAATSRITMLLNHAMREVAGVWHWILLEQ